MLWRFIFLHVKIYLYIFFIIMSFLATRSYRGGRKKEHTCYSAATAFNASYRTLYSGYMVHSTTKQKITMPTGEFFLHTAFFHPPAFTLP